MSQRIKLPKRTPGVRVELGEESGQVVEFELKPVTLDIEEQLTELQRQAQEVEMNPDSRATDLCEAEVVQFDVILEPTGAQGNSRAWTTKPSELLLGDPGDPEADPPRERHEGYLTGAITRSQIQGTLQKVIQAARP